KLVDMLIDRLSHSDSRMVLLTACFLFFLHITRFSDQHLQALYGKIETLLEEAENVFVTPDFSDSGCYVKHLPVSHWSCCFCAQDCRACPDPS
ncbi:hypothetical protein GOODEAATRI_005419, partial [Goodea atripinnis]